jgi:phosphatidylglycerophosphate synthase
MVAVGALAPLTPVAWVAGLTYLVVSTLLLAAGLRDEVRFGQANAVTATRSTLVGLITALVVASFQAGISTPLLVSLVACALILDGVDGYVARRTGSESDIGARFDMEVDAFLLLVLCVYDVRFVGWWVLTIGVLRYAFVVAGWMLPWMRRTLPPRHWRKVVTAVCGVALALVASQLLPPAGNALVTGTALFLVLESFGRDVLWLARVNHTARALVSLEKAPTTSPQEESR